MRFLWLVLVLATCGGPNAQPGERPVTPSERPAEPTAAPVSSDAPPGARTVDVVEEKFGLVTPDPYRWMEGDTNAEVATWLTAQGDYAAKRLAALPDRDKLFARMRELGLGTSTIFGSKLAGGRLFHYETAANEQRGKLVVREADGKSRALIDPNTAAEPFSVDNFAPTHDGKLVAYNHAAGGAEISSIRIVDVATGKPLPDVVDRIWGEFPVTWLPDGKAFFYTQMAPPAPGVDLMLGMRVKLHRLGAPVADDPTIASSYAYAPSEFPSLDISADRRWLIAYGTGARPEVRIAIAKLASFDRMTAKLPLQPVADYADRVAAADAWGDRLYLLSQQDAPNGRLISVPLAKPMLASARVEVPEDPAVVLSGFAIAKDGIYLNERVDGYARLRFRAWGKQPVVLPLPFEGTLNSVATDPAAAGVTIQLTGWTRPSAQFRLDPRTQQFVSNGVAAQSTADYSAIVAEKLAVRAADGELVPLSILRRKDVVADGKNPTMLVGYAAYSASQLPFFSPTNLAWLERGGVLAYCHARGGGDKGDRWYRSGVREHKLVGIRDFVACGEALVAARWTSPDRLGSWGVSMGGILVGRAVVENPELFRVAILSVGTVNPLRILHAANGANQVAELGDPATEQGYRQIHAIDPYVQAKPDARYPAMLLTVGLNDNRVAPWMTAKLAAKLQAAKPARPVWIRVDTKAGHGIGSGRDQVFAERADIYAFALAQFSR